MAFQAPKQADTQTALVADADGAAVPVGEVGENLDLLIDVTVATAGTLDVAVEWSHNGTDFAPADPVDVFTQITAVGLVVKSFEIKAPHFRLAYTVVTGPFTFTVSKFITA